MTGVEEETPLGARGTSTWNKSEKDKRDTYNRREQLEFSMDKVFRHGRVGDDFD